MLTVEPQTWPVLAEDPEWSMRQGPRLDRSLSNGSTLIIEFVWCTSTGVTASCEVDGEPLQVAPEFDRDRTTAIAEVLAILTELWKSIEVPA